MEKLLINIRNDYSVFGSFDAAEGLQVQNSFDTNAKWIYLMKSERKEIHPLKQIKYKQIHLAVKEIYII